MPWRRIARAFERNVRGVYRDGKGIALGGICNAVAFTSICPYGVTGDMDSYRMGDELHLFRHGTSYCYWWPRTREGDDCRVIAAGLLAAMTEAGDLG